MSKSKNNEPLKMYRNGNWYRIPITDGHGRKWMSIEQMYQAAKFKENSKHYRKILALEYDDKNLSIIEASRDWGMKIWSLGNEANEDLRENWEEDKFDVMIVCVAYKMTNRQCADCVEELLESGSNIITSPPSSKEDQWKHFMPALLMLNRDIISVKPCLTALELVRSIYAKDGQMCRPWI